VDLVGDHAGHPTPHRFSADHHVLTAAEGVYDFAPRRQQDRLAIGRFPPRRHVRKLESHHTNAARGHSAREDVHEGDIHRRPSPVSQDQDVLRVFGSIGQEWHFGFWILDFGFWILDWAFSARISSPIHMGTTV
jgi:hypothetical protein